MSRVARRRFTDDFKCEAVRLTQTSGRTIRQVADDLGIGLSTLPRWRHKHIEIEKAFSKLKALLRTAATRTIPEL
jgi:transposase